MTTFMIEEYRQAVIIGTSGLAEDEAFTRVFGLTPLELGYHLLSIAHLPGPILSSLLGLPHNAVKLATEQPGMELLMLADFSVRICELALRSDVSAEEFDRCTRALAAKSGQMFGLDAEGVMDVLREASKQLTIFTTTFGLSSLSRNVSPRIQARLTGANPAGFVTVRPPVKTVPSEEETPTAQSPALYTGLISREPRTSPNQTPPKETAAKPEYRAPPPPEISFQQAFESGIEQLAGLLDQEPVDLNRVYRVVMQSAMQGFSAAEGMLFVREEMGHRYLAKHPAGAFAATTQNQLAIRDDERDVFGICLQRQEDVLIYDTTDSKISPHLPAWIKKAQIASFVLLPLSDNRKPFALLFAGWGEKKTVGFSVNQIRQVRSMLKLAGTARRLSEL